MTEVAEQPKPQEEDGTPIWLSKTLWTSIVVAAAPLFPPVAQIVVTNPTLCSFVVGAVFSVLRVVTKTPLKVSK